MASYRALACSCVKVFLSKQQAEDLSGKVKDLLFQKDAIDRLGIDSLRAQLARTKVVRQKARVIGCGPLVYGHSMSGNDASRLPLKRPILKHSQWHPARCVFYRAEHSSSWFVLISENRGALNSTTIVVFPMLLLSGTFPLLPPLECR